MMLARLRPSRSPIRGLVALPVAATSNACFYASMTLVIPFFSRPSKGIGTETIRKVIFSKAIVKQVIAFL